MKEKKDMSALKVVKYGCRSKNVEVIGGRGVVRYSSVIVSESPFELFSMLFERYRISSYRGIPLTNSSDIFRRFCFLEMGVIPYDTSLRGFDNIYKSKLKSALRKQNEKTPEFMALESRAMFEVLTNYHSFTNFQEKDRENYVLVRSELDDILKKYF